MKTKTNIYKFFLIFSLFLCFPFTSQALNLTTSDWLVPQTAGVMENYYEVTWCSPHAGNVADSRFSSPSNLCKKWYFYKNGTQWIMTYRWEHFINWDVQLKVTAPIPTETRVTDLGIMDLFDVSSVKFEWEWTYTIKILLIDHAYNASKFEFTYKIDKTAPQIQLTGINENTPYTYVDPSLPRLSGLNGYVSKYDSNVLPSINGENYIFPNSWNYTGDNPLSRFWTLHKRINLYPIYFSRLNSTDQFTISVAYSDTYNGSLLWWTNYLAWEKDFELLEETWNNPLKSNILLTTNISLVTWDFWAHPDNTQKKYRLRLYDKTTPKSWGKPNYSEVIFYAVKDNTPPNMTKADLSQSARELAIQKSLKFSDNSTTAWDTGTTISSMETNWAVSKFIAADSGSLLRSTLNDIWISTQPSNSSSTYAWSNAGIPFWATGTKIQIETADYLVNYSDVILYEQRFLNNIPQRKRFDIVDNDRLNWQRKYTTKFLSTWISGNDQLCDNVWNCLNPKLDFRVVANILDDTTSNITLTSSQTKIFANASDYYTVNSKFEDKYGNKIVWVRAVENNNKTIKTIDTDFDFKNGLFNDLQWETGTGSKQVFVWDTQTDNSWALTQTASINNILSQSTLHFQENIEANYNSSGWIYSFRLSSKTPSVGLYPYLNSWALLQLTRIKPKSTVTPSWVWVYWWNIIWLWDFDRYTKDNISLTGGMNFLTGNTDFLHNPDYTTDLTGSKVTDYGKITFTNASDIKFNTFNQRKMELEFAAPFIYGAQNLSLSHLINNVGQTKKHIKQYYKLSSQISDMKIFEKYIPFYSNITPRKFTPNIFNIHSDHTIWIAKINSWRTISPPFATQNFLTGAQFTKSSPINTSYQVSGYSFYVGYISKLMYKIWWSNISLPSISRNIGPSSDWDQKILARNYFPETWTPATSHGSYVIQKDPIISAGLRTGLWIWITWLSKSKRTLLTDDSKWTKANINIWDTQTRFDLMTTFKKNAQQNSQWITWCNGPITLSQSDINTPMTSSSIKDCSIEINHEMITYVKWDVNIDCWVNTCLLKNNYKRTVVVKDGSTYIKSNISTFGKNSKLFIWTIADAGMKNITIPPDINPHMDRSTLFWWVLIDPSVTNIDAYIVSQWPMVSYQKIDATQWKLFNNPSSSELANQLHIYGSVLTLNTMGWYKSDIWDSECPYITKDSCNQQTAFIFDLITLRRYSLIWESAGSNNLIPSWNGKRSGQNRTPLVTNWWEPLIITNWDTSGIDGLRYIKDPDYIIYPLFIEKDPLWNNDPSIMFRTDR